MRLRPLSSYLTENRIRRAIGLVQFPISPLHRLRNGWNKIERKKEKMTDKQNESESERKSEEHENKTQAKTKGNTPREN